MPLWRTAPNENKIIPFCFHAFHRGFLFIAVSCEELTPIRPLFSIVAFFLTLAASAASYRWLESGFLRAKTRYEVIRTTPVFKNAAA